MKKLVFISLAISLINANSIDSYLKKLEVQAKKENPSFSDFSYEREKKIYY